MKILTPVVALVLTLIVAATPAWAATVTAIKISGNERVEAETVRSYLPFKEGGQFHEEQTSDIIKSLYGTGLFANVDLKYDNGTVALTVVENPMVNRVAFEGNKEIDTKRLEELVSLKARAIYSPAKVQADVQALEAAYRSRGRFTSTVKAQLIQRDQNRVDVIYAVDEGHKTRIAQLNFVGNKRFSDEELQGIVATKPSAWWRFLSSNDTYDAGRLDVDKELLRRFYLSKGYADVQITSAVAELTRDQKTFIITYTVFEGPRYTYAASDLTLAADAPGLKADDFKKVITLEKGDTFNAKEIEDVTGNLIDALGNKGYAFLDVAPDYKKDEAAKTIAVNFVIHPGPKVYIDRINISGNTRTRDYVIRREMRLAEGDAYSADKLKRSKDRLQYLGFFEKSDVTTKPTAQPDKVDLDVKVKEQSTGEFNVGAGYSTFDGLLASADVRERNFLGKGQDVNAKFAISQRQQQYNLGFTEPYFLGQELSAGADVFNEQTSYQDESQYDRGTLGGDIRFGFPLSEYTKNNVTTGFKRIKISDVGTGASQFVQRDAGSKNSAFLSNTWSFDNRDSQLTPSRGYRVALTGEYSGFGTADKYLRGLANVSWNKELMDDWVLTLAGKAGAVSGLGGTLPVYEHFMGGGQDLRGFAFGGIGPRDRVTEDALGGRYVLGNSVEMRFPLGGTLKELGVQGVTFVDGGTVTSFDGGSSATVNDPSLYRVAAGAGIFWQSPLGPLRLDLGVPVVKASGDRSQLFNFSVGSRF
ncbi:MAG TPA: outer membrane protein assembly factor BamA [Alphaproteobacteria bacterium]|nr:outer membrane protein assembly factor BamA [Alphaproteobacteria bacterium]